MTNQNGMVPHISRCSRCGSLPSRWYSRIVPLGLKRFQESKQAHFVTFSCYRQLRFLNNERVRDLFLECFERARQRYRLRVFGYVVMPEHIHLLVSEPELGSLATAIQALKISISRRTSSNRKRLAPLWQKRYYDHNVRDYESFVEKLRYIHRNPVKRGLCKDPIEWRWSSFRHYATAEIGIVEIESEWTAMRREGKDPHLLRRCGTVE